MPEQLKVSIVIPCYNSEKWILTCIQSCVGQTYHNIEIIVVDDGSTDQSVEIIKNFKDQRIKLIQQKRQGANAARNIGAKISDGRWIVFLDSDDFLHLQAIEKQVQSALMHRDAVIACKTRMFLDGSESKILKSKVGAKVDRFECQVYESKAFLKETRIEKKWLQPQTAGWLFPRDSILQVNGFDESLEICQEVELYVRIFPLFGEIVLNDFEGIFYRKYFQGKDNIFNFKSRQKVEDLSKALLKIEKNILEKWNAPEILTVLVYDYLRFMVFPGRQYLFFFWFCAWRLLRLRGIMVVFDLIYLFLNFLSRKLLYGNSWKAYLPC